MPTKYVGMLIFSHLHTMPPLLLPPRQEPTNFALLLRSIKKRQKCLLGTRFKFRREEEEEDDDGDDDDGGGGGDDLLSFHLINHYL